MENYGTYPIGLDTPIHMLTPRQLFEMQAEWQSAIVPAAKQEENGGRWYVNSVAELAGILGSSESTIYRMKRDGLLDEAISQYGKWVMIDVNKVIEVFRLSNRRPRKKKG